MSVIMSVNTKSIARKRAFIAVIDYFQVYLLLRDTLDVTHILTSTFMQDA